MMKPTVSVVMITYGHEKYIREAITGVLMQECGFEVELIIANDCSPDNTDAVINEFINHPNINWIKYTKHSQNMGMMPNFIWSLQQAKGKYVAICEGDDYWIDSLKLQKQVDFLEVNHDYSMTCHNAIIKYEGDDEKNMIFNENLISHDISMQNIVEKWIIPTASMVFRKEYIMCIPDWINKIYSGDFTLALLLRSYGKVWFCGDIMSVYRVDYSGSSASATYCDRGIFVLNQHLLLLDYFNNYTEFKYSKMINRRILQIQTELKFLDLKSKGIFYLLLRMPLTVMKKITGKISAKFNKVFKLKSHV
jgi:glycosyltransferase involved in cell wall biosynthesis